MAERNLIMPGNPRYQPKDLRRTFGYDNLYRPVGEVELACLEVLHEVGLIPEADYALLTEEARTAVLDITTTEVDDIERRITHHDVRAWVRCAQERLDPRLGRWLHILLTSYDVLDTGRTLQYVRAYTDVLRPKTLSVIEILAGLVRRFAAVPQIGRTHGQHAIPITVGFWLATILHRVIFNLEEMEHHSANLVGKISGAVGAYNAQAALGIEACCREQGNNESFEERVLSRLGLEPASISTQILPPEPLAYFLHSCLLLLASLGQLGRDCRHLMRSEIAEVAEATEAEQVGSSTMPHKRNPFRFEGIEAHVTRTIGEYLKVLLTLISEHQRDLTGSAVARDFPIILINLCTVLDTLLRSGPTSPAFLARLTVRPEICHLNLEASGTVIMAEPLYIALQMAGHPDAHQLVNDSIAPEVRRSGQTLLQVTQSCAQNDATLASALEQIPAELMKLLDEPVRYTGLAKEKALEITRLADSVLDTFRVA